MRQDNRELEKTIHNEELYDQYSSNVTGETKSE
jgi:hypothetical protein